MSKLPHSSICKFIRPSRLVPLLALAGCLSPRAGQNETTEVMISETDASSSSSSEGGSTIDGIMTTTEEPESDSSGDPDGTTGDESTTGATTTTATTTTEIPPNCGDGVVQAPEEECDDGNDNANDAACTEACKQATCGDGLVHAGVEVCDDEVNDGSYGKCAVGCAALGPHCGDSVIQIPQEECDESTPANGCLKDQCALATSCLEIKDAWGGEAVDGMYTLFPKDEVDLEAYCDMTTDDGGYTFVKFGGDNLLSAAAAEIECGKIGMQLLVPRTADHLASAANVAFDADVTPIEGQNPNMPSAYLRIFGIYPVTEGQSCIDQPLNKMACPEWKASDGEAYWISETKLGQGQPSTTNCMGCSMAYYWAGQTLTSYEAQWGGGDGAISTHFLCDVGDKRPQM
jgi:cysteine-rich repeat protein